MTLHFISVIGSSPGVGKSTLCRALAQWLSGTGADALGAAAMNTHGIRRLVCVTSDLHPRACVEVITTQGTPNYATVFLKEALRIGK
ncbi:hypothetical protein ACFVT5_32375 [Streptomyces sp. NPDC058001]|uniref:hypothetical protein n=1 Tax=Streptomyces sp. NPDC058001 TaxID=3346300 RepID=UPI0036EAC38E